MGRGPIGEMDSYGILQDPKILSRLKNKFGIRSQKNFSRVEDLFLNYRHDVNTSHVSFDHFV